MAALTVLVISDPAGAHLKALDRLPPETNLIVSNDHDNLRERAPTADVIVNIHGDGALLGQLVPLAVRARWIHTLFTGVDKLLSPALAANTIPFTNGRGAFQRPLGEWTVGVMLHFAYNLRQVIRQQEAGAWEPVFSRGLHGSTLGIVGYGSIGRAAAERAKPFGVKIAALRRRAEPDPLIDAAYPPAELNRLLADSDYALLATPLTSETRGMIGESQIAAMKPTAVLINVGRGAVVDEPALIRALESGKIRGAALDVFETEPLPAGHPFYKMQNVLMSPHTADRVEDFWSLAYERFFENFERFQTGQPLLYMVDKRAGY
jgi:phosphoglycerate dehydrogenase-like enzyme